MAAYNRFTSNLDELEQEYPEFAESYRQRADIADNQLLQELANDRQQRSHRQRRESRSFISQLFSVFLPF